MGSWNIASNQVYAQAEDPGAVGAGSFWTDTNANLTYRRNDANTGWNLVGSNTAVDATEYGYIDGVTSAIQTQIDTKAPTASPTFTGTVTGPTYESTKGITLQAISKVWEDFFVYSTVTTNNPTGGPYTFNDVQGTNVGAMLDGLNNGFQITTGATSSDRASINTNNIRHFNPAACTIYGIIGFDNSANWTYCGICENTDPSNGDGTNENVTCALNTTLGFVALSCASAAGQTEVTSDVATGTANVAFKIVCGASNQKLYLLVAGVWTLKATQSTRLPTAAMQPIFNVRTVAADTAVSRISYLRVQND